MLSHRKTVSRKTYTYTGVEDLLLQVACCPLKGFVNRIVWSCSDALQKDSDSITVDLQDIRQFDDDLYELFRRDPGVAMPLVSSNLDLPIYALDLRNTL